MPNAAPRRPTAGYLAAATIARACSAVSTIGTMIPIAPMSSTRAMKSYSVAGTRTSGTRLVERVVARSVRIVSTLQPVCSMSKTRKSAPASAMMRAMPGVLNSKTNVPTGILPAASRDLIVLLRISARPDWKPEHPTARFASRHARSDNSVMSWVLYLFGSGQALFLGAGMILAAVALLPRVSGWKSVTLAMVARLGLVLAILSAVPLSYWLYAVAIGVTGVWLWRERRYRGELEASASRWDTQECSPQERHRGAHAPRSPIRGLRRATALIWLGIIVLE